MDETMKCIKGNPFGNLHPAEIPTRMHEYKWNSNKSRLKDRKNMDEVMKRIKEGKGLPPLDERKTLNLAMQMDSPVVNKCTRTVPTFKRKIVLEAYVQTSYDQYTHMFKTVEIELPDNGIDWHVVGEVYEEKQN